MDFLNEQNNNNQIINNNNNNVNKQKKLPTKQILKKENSTQNNFEMNNLFANEDELNNMNVKISEICDLNLLKIIIENSTTLPKGEIIFITPIGLIGSIRSKNFKEEGIFFGYYKNINNINVDIDYMLPPSNIIDENNFISEEYKKNLLMSIESKKYKSENNNNNNNLFEEIENKNEGKFFKIFFDKNTEKYFIKDLGSGFGTFIRLMKDENYILKDNTLINIGNSFLIFSYSNNFDTNNLNEENNNNNLNNYFTNNYDSIENCNLYLKICSGENKYSTFVFDDKNKIYSLGRNDKCDVIIHDKMLSRIHCIVCYDKNYNIWVIKDGGDKGMSTNGTWIFAFDEIEIKEGMIFKINANLLSCHFGN